MIEVRLTFAGLQEAAVFFSRHLDKIEPADVPSVGATVAPSPKTAVSFPPIEPPADPAAVFGSAVAQIPPPVRSSAAAEAQPTAPAAPTATSLPPPPVITPPAPPTAPEAAAPTAPAAPTNLADAERDAKGMPWDERIHAQNKSKNQDGTWRQKRGLNDPSYEARVEAELRGAAPATAATPPAPPAAVQAAPATPPAPPATAATPWTFDRLLTAVVKSGMKAEARDSIMQTVAGVHAFGELAGKLATEPELGERLAVAWGLQ